MPHAHNNVEVTCEPITHEPCTLHLQSLYQARNNKRSLSYLQFPSFWLHLQIQTYNSTQPTSGLVLVYM